MDAVTGTSNEPKHGPIDQAVYLIGYPPLQDYIQFVRTRAVGGYHVEEAPLVKEWRASHEVLGILQKSEAGIADNLPTIPLPDSMSAIAKSSLDHDEAKLTFQTLPHAWSLVDVDNLVVTQRSVNLGFARKLRAALPGNLTNEALIDLAIGNGPLPPDMQITQLSERMYSFSSPSWDLRFLETALLKPTQIYERPTHGYPAAVLAVFVGFGINYISAIRVHGRLILLNGTHRLYALREAGIRRVPCLVREATHTHDLSLVGASEIEHNAELYLRSSRPPLFKDYFDDRLVKSLDLPRGNLVLHLQLNTQHWRMPTF
jgi:hypothetical protein